MISNRRKRNLILFIISICIAILLMNSKVEAIETNLDEISEGPLINSSDKDVLGDSSTNHDITIEVQKIFLDSNKPLGYDLGEKKTITVPCSVESCSIKSRNHSISIRHCHPSCLDWEEENWIGWQKGIYYSHKNESYYVGAFATFSKYITLTTMVQASGRVSPLKADTRVYLIYKRPDPVVTKKITLKYDANAGSNAPKYQTKVTTDGKVILTISSEKPTRKGYEFLGWADKKDGTVTYNLGERIMLESDKTLYAVWKIEEKQTKELSYKIEYYKDNVKADEEDVTVEVQVLEPNTIRIDKDKINKVKYDGYKFIKTEPSEIAETVNNGDIIKIYYEKELEKAEDNNSKNIVNSNKPEKPSDAITNNNEAVIDTQRNIINNNIPEVENKYSILPNTGDIIPTTAVSIIIFVIIINIIYSISIPRTGKGRHTK